MAILVFVFLWKTVSYNTILFWSGLNWIPKTYYEQMALEGGGHLAQFRQVTWIYLGADDVRGVFDVGRQRV